MPCRFCAGRSVVAVCPVDSCVRCAVPIEVGCVSRSVCLCLSPSVHVPGGGGTPLRGGCKGKPRGRHCSDAVVFFTLLIDLHSADRSQETTFKNLVSVTSMHYIHGEATPPKPPPISSHSPSPPSRSPPPATKKLSPYAGGRPSPSPERRLNGRHSASPPPPTGWNEALQMQQQKRATAEPLLARSPVRTSPSRAEVRKLYGRVDPVLSKLNELPIATLPPSSTGRHTRRRCARSWPPTPRSWRAGCRLRRGCLCRRGRGAWGRGVRGRGRGRWRGRGGVGGGSVGGIGSDQVLALSTSATCC